MLTTIENYNGMFVIAVFVLLFTVIWNSLKRSSIFPENICFVIALCVSVLCIIGLFGLGKTKTRLIKGPTSSLVKVAPPVPLTPAAEPNKKKINFILLPYAALAISILFALLLLMFQKGSSWMKNRRNSLKYWVDKNPIKPKQNVTNLNKNSERMRK